MPRIPDRTIRTFATLSLFIGAVGTALAQAPYLGPVYENKGSIVDPGPPPKVSQWHVGLSTSAGKPIWDDELANYAKPLAMAGVKMAYGFGQCFGGGMIQDLVALGGDISATSATKWSRPAYYRESTPPAAAAPVRPGLAFAAVANNHNYDWVDSYIQANGGGANHLNAANDAWRYDPFGTNPATNRGPNEMGGIEFGQFGQTAAGAAAGFNHGVAAANKFAILYSGKPNAIDGEQIVDAWNMLVGVYGYMPANIQVLYGAGVAPVGAPAAMVGQTVAATDVNMMIAYANLGGLTAMDQLFFLANDHGTAWNDLMGNRNRFYLDVPKTPSQWSPSQGLDQYGPDTNWSTVPYYVPTPGTATLLAIGAMLTTRRRRAA
ncbi:MAG: hypothetical protein KIT24_09655 [Phycisphaeraceae bacterium]|nr:hypothetical protein [Phycisphaeraceae bacterium]